jgi:hypothetical protein
MEYPDADRFLREMLLHRYSQIINSMEAKFSLTKEQMVLLRERILNIRWMDINN